MGFRFRKSVKIAPGVRLNIGKKSVGISAGVKGARVSVNSSGRVTKSVGIPGTGLSYVTTSKLGGAGEPDEPEKQQPVAPMDETPEPQSDPPQPPRKYTGLKTLSVILIALGLLLSIATIAGGLVVTALGCVGLHHRASRIAQDAGQTPTAPYKRKWQIGVAAAFVALSVAGAVTPDPINSITVDGLAPTQLEVPEPREIVFEYTPAESSPESITCTSSDSSVASVEVTEAGGGKVTCMVTPLAAGDVTITCEASTASAPALEMTVSDPAAEEAARLAAEQAAREEAERKAAEEAAAQAEAERKAAEEAAAQAEAERKAAEEAAAAQAAAEQQAAEEAAAAQAAVEQEQSTGQTVYITPSGERWHRSPTCGGKNSYPVDISDVGGRTPCKKCAGG